MHGRIREGCDGINRPSDRTPRQRLGSAVRWKQRKVGPYPVALSYQTPRTRLPAPNRCASAAPSAGEETSPRAVCASTVWASTTRMSPEAIQLGAQGKDQVAPQAGERGVGPAWSEGEYGDVRSGRHHAGCRSAWHEASDRDAQQEEHAEYRDDPPGQGNPTAQRWLRGLGQRGGKVPAVAKRSAGARASARRIVRSRDSGTASRTERMLRTGSTMIRASTACAVGPVWGGSPTISSYRTQPSE